MNKAINQKLQHISSMRLALPIVIILAIAFGFVGVRAIADDPVETTIASINCQVTCIEVRDSGFSPGEVAIKTGEYVQFNSKDTNRHNLALGNGTKSDPEETHSQPIEEHGHEEGTPAEHGHDEEVKVESTHSTTHDHQSGTESGEFGIGEAWKVQFKKPGTYIIHDHLYPNNSILVVVYDPSSMAE